MNDPKSTDADLRAPAERAKEDPANVDVQPWKWTWGNVQPPSAAFIAACSPDSIIALLDRIAWISQWGDDWRRQAVDEHTESERLRTSLTRAEEQLATDRLVAESQLALIDGWKDRAEWAWRRIEHLRSFHRCEDHPDDAICRAALPAQPKEGE